MAVREGGLGFSERKREEEEGRRKVIERAENEGILCWDRCGGKKRSLSLPTAKVIFVSICAPLLLYFFLIDPTYFLSNGTIDY